MATPHVTGAAALYLSRTGNTSKTPAQVATAVISSAQSWINVSGRASTTNKTLRVISY